MGEQGKSRESLCFNLLAGAFANKLWMCRNPETPTSPWGRVFKIRPAYPLQNTLLAASETKWRVLGQSANIQIFSFLVQLLPLRLFRG